MRHLCIAREASSLHGWGKGCGQTSHCLACAGRNTTEAAFESGNPRIHIPVEPVQDGGGLKMTMSAEKIGAWGDDHRTNKVSLAMSKSRGHGEKILPREELAGC